MEEVGSACHNSMSKRTEYPYEGFPFSIRTEYYREALKRVKRYTLGVYPVFNKVKREVHYILMSRSLNGIQTVCRDFNFPMKWINNSKRKTHGYFFVLLRGAYALKWTAVLKGRRSDKNRTWRSY